MARRPKRINPSPENAVQFLQDLQVISPAEADGMRAWLMAGTVQLPPHLLSAFQWTRFALMVPPTMTEH